LTIVVDSCQRYSTTPLYVLQTLCSFFCCWRFILISTFVLFYIFFWIYI